MNQDETKMTVQDRSTEFVPVEGGGDGSSALGLLVAAYILMWFFVFAFVWQTSRRVAVMAARVDDLEASLKKAEGTILSSSS